MKILQPKTSFRKQSQTDTPVVSDSTLVDDPVALVDSTTSLVGGQSVIYSDMKIDTKTIVPKTIIKTIVPKGTVEQRPMRMTTRFRQRG